ncbi:ComF family protein [Streptomyces lichenis]|uniref:ComF family protein n=1 Tax=Streptomyces lichenis TaxID=2306967 RepID=A0ABT0I619_9ACTN|nr:ComF family protein [Streptomyces lichenis]MCK8676764.1 ComF family protein [Streptomyces lichenis]
MRQWWDEIAGLVLPVDCAGCGRPRTRWCEGCAQALYGSGAQRVRPVPEPAGLPPVFAAAPYANAPRAVLLGHKERGALPSVRPLGAALAEAVRAAAADCPTSAARRSLAAARGGGGGPLLLVPVPSARRAVRARGHDPGRRIAAAAAAELRRTGTPARVLPVLRQRGRVADQAALTARERLDNMAGALELVPGGGRLLDGWLREGGRPVLVDDLMTTGASLAEASRALAAALPAGRRGPPAAVVCAPAMSFELNRNGRGTCIVAGGES